MNKLDSTPTAEDKKRVSVDVNENFHIELHYAARKDSTTVSDVTRYFWEEYLAGKLKFKKEEE